MNPDIFGGFVLAAAIILIVPGPTILLVISLAVGVTFLLLAFVNAALYGLFSGRLRDRMQNPRVRRWFHRCGGTALVGAGLLTATMQRSS